MKATTAASRADRRIAGACIRIRSYERIKAATPEFEELAAFQAGGGSLSVRREGGETASRPLRSEYVTGNYFSTFGVGAFGGRVLTPDDDRPGGAAGGGAQSPYLAERVRRRSDGRGLDLHACRATRSPSWAWHRRDSLAKRFAAIRPTCGFPCRRNLSSAAAAHCCGNRCRPGFASSVGLRPGASIDGMSPRLTELLRNWMRNDSGYPANWMPDVIRMLPQQVINVVPAGSGVAVMKEEYGRSLQILLAVCGLVLLIACANVANLLLARAVARRTQTALRMAVGATRRQIVTQALIESVLLAVAGGVAGLAVSIAAARLLLALAFGSSSFLPDQRRSLAARPWSRIPAGAHDRHRLRRRARVVRDADRSRGRASRGRPDDGRSVVVHASGAPGPAGDPVGGARGRRHDAGAQSEQARVAGLRLSGGGPRRRVAQRSAGRLHGAQAAGDVSPARGAAECDPRRQGIGPGALQSAHQQLG